MASSRTAPSVQWSLITIPISFFTKFASLCRLARRFAKALWRRYRTPPELRDVDFEAYVDNLQICKTCPMRNKDTCDACGCHIPTKARWMSESCELGQWDNTDFIPIRLAQLAGQAPNSTPQQQ